ncbi:MAG: sodium:alanine symporter family protein [Bacteroidetes bacterium]|nr:MAG: sodium:alanine symporter family protein [Bacteroidota bacterium]RLD71581.1 MAG: sodium:alanine symporter family protein [Bacteroidota bacterium]RLE02803.1 MAG: sodium:alanine symporter family protein [Bacteroidota bacterium]
MQKVNEFLLFLNNYLGGHAWFVYLLLGTGVFFTLYLGLPQIRYFGHAIRIVKGRFDRADDIGDTSHFQALTTALSGTVGTGNIAGVALAIHLGGPAALFWMLVTAMLGMTTKFVEVTISHKYRDILPDGSISGGPMYYMKKRMNITTRKGKIIKTGAVLGAFFAFATILSSFGTGSLPQINSISESMFTSFGINHTLTGGVLAVLLGLVIIGGIKRIAKVTSTLVPMMALIYVVGAILVIATNYQNILPSLGSIFTDAFTGSAAVGGFLGAGFAFTFNKGVNRGLFSNEAGQGSAPIAHSAAKAQEPVSEGMVAILEPFIDTIIICTITGLVLLSSGVWNEKIDNRFQQADLQIVEGTYLEEDENDRVLMARVFSNDTTLALFTGSLQVEEGTVTSDGITIIHAESFAENVVVTRGKEKYTGPIPVSEGVVRFSELSGEDEPVYFSGSSLIHSAALTTEAFKRSWMGDWGQYIVSIGLLLFAFSTAISWSYYGGRAVTYLFGTRYVIVYRFIYVVGFFLASFTDTTIVWNLSYITIAIMTIPNLFGLLILRKDIKRTITAYWSGFKKEWPQEKLPMGINRD